MNHSADEGAGRVHRSIIRVLAPLLLAAAGLAAGCGGGGGGDGQTGGGGSGGGSGEEPFPANVVVSGGVTFDLVPVLPGSPGGLDYAATEPSPARAVSVEFVEGTAVLAAATTDDTGAFALTVPSSREGFLRVKAESVRAGAPGWDFRVVDNTSGDALYAIEGAVFDTGTADSERDLHAASGWTGAGYTEPRAAAPFAILDAVYDGAELVLAADPALQFPPLVLHWSPDNVPSMGSDGAPEPATGEIGTSFYSSALGGIFLLGAEDADTEEYDRHVILHEWAHYLEDRLSRSDSIGGPHTLSDTLDMRVAFGEGWGNAFSAIAAEDSVYRDSTGPAQAFAGSFDVEGPRFFEPDNPAPGWYSEQSVHELLYDLVDADADAAGGDAIQMDFAALYQVFTGDYRDTPALTSVFPFINALKQQNPGDAALIDALTAAQVIDDINDDYGDTETNDAGSVNDDVLPIYSDLDVGGAAVNVCSTDEYRGDQTGLVNKLATRRYLRFSLPVQGGATITVTATSIPDGESADPDFILHRSGPFLISDSAPSAACADPSDPGWAPSDCEESLTVMTEPPLAAGGYVLEVYEWTNTLSDEDEYPPIGRTCFDVTVTQP